MTQGTQTARDQRRELHGMWASVAPAWGEHAAVVGAPVPLPGIPGPFALQDADRLGRLLTGAGLAGVVVDEVAVPLREASFDAWLTRTSALAGPLAKRLARLPDPARQQLRTRLEEAVRPYRSPAGLDFPGVSLVAAGRRPAG